ncbi:three-Cys-motif partner protein TcmP [Candidatus Binatus sp.]|uniref:three-Cys-motif partner protein TcmP n=1 Tax=Candidatus Binatus sp. TaxID=2811406 RepID=UPI002FDB031A
MKLLASDGLLARPARIWTREKLTYLRKYATAFMTAMAKKPGPGQWERLVYLDFLCGPGRDIDTDIDEEFSGSPLIALAIEPHFDHLYLADKDSKNVEALEARISVADKPRVTLRTGDCNLIIDNVLKSISGRTLGLAFIDPEGFEVDFATLAKLAKRRIDLLYLFPSGIGVKRNLKNFLAVPESPMDRFWGGKDWRDLPEARRAAGTSQEEDPGKIVQSLVSAFRQKLREVGFTHQDGAAPLFTNTRNAQMYHLLYLSHDEIGLKIWRGIKKISPGGQRPLPGIG